MHVREFHTYVARTLLYYEIFQYPLSAKELYTLFPKNSLRYEEFKTKLDELVGEKTLRESYGYYFLPQEEKDFAVVRREREEHARSHIRLAKVFTFIIKQFPFVRGVFLSGELSKNVASKESDIDYVIITAKNRLWITRSLLILFKKTILLNSKKYFCLNYFVTEDCFLLNENNYYTATEVAHLKPLYNFPLFLRYINANAWIKTYFPNYSVFALTGEPKFETSGLLQKFFELALSGRWVDSLDTAIMNKMKTVWQHRYSEYQATTHERLFRCTPNESRAFVGNFSEKIETLYKQKLQDHNLL